MHQASEDRLQVGILPRPQLPALEHPGLSHCHVSAHGCMARISEEAKPAYVRCGMAKNHSLLGRVAYF
ncbi:hypothetical protein L1765_09180 [Microaerobacter geothermalis]|uniref:hypothetical protein n=1 Tax=Microaerobacter geothermalis TaxID=674972 RepID=UPI001F45196E|nr:hypothetical protein [Microaerobacter geothermalis]MCF6094134.1 hypothetical protein [Microaerobacter geothermalis]